MTVPMFIRSSVQDNMLLRYELCHPLFGR
jgi:hypothetical protein